MSVQIARSGKVFHSVESIEELREEIRAGRVLPTDHFHMSGMPDWRLVSTLPEPPRPNELHQQAVAADPDALIAHRRAQIRELIEQPANPRPEKCRRCDTPTLKSSKLVWQQSTRVGGAIDTNLDVTFFGSSTLQGIDLAPPTEPSIPGDQSGSFLTKVVSGLILTMVPSILNALFMAVMFAAGFEFGKRELGIVGRVLLGALFIGYFMGIIYLGYVAARRFYKWDARRGLLNVCEVELARAQAHLRWRNTWICTSCGGKTIARP